MCGIFGYIGSQQALPIPLKVFAGWSTVVTIPPGFRFTMEQRWKRTKRSERLRSPLSFCLLGFNVGHCTHATWATHGGVTDLNAHPHASRDGRIHLVHKNFRLLRRRLTAQGIDCVSETDSKVLVHMVALEMFCAA